MHLAGAYASQRQPLAAGGARSHDRHRLRLERRPRRHDGSISSRVGTWFAVPLFATLAVAVLTRSLRRRRHGPRASTQVREPSDVLAVVLCGWFGLAAIGAFVADVRGGSGLTGLGVFFGLLGACLLIIDAVLVYRYVVRE